MVKRFLNDKIIKLISCLIPNRKLRKRFRSFFTLKTSILENNGINNKIILIDDNGNEKEITFIDGLNIRFYGSNNLIKLYAPMPRFINSEIQMEDNALVSIGASKFTLKDFIIWRMRKDTKVNIGKDFSCVGVEIAFMGEEKLEVTVGNNCMFSHHICLQPTDSHAIIDVNTNKPINYGGNIHIGNHVWLCPNVRIHKNVTIPDNCIIGACSVVNKTIQQENILAVGTPAKIIKDNVTWSRYSAYDYMRNNLGGAKPLLLLNCRVVLAFT